MIELNPLFTQTIFKSSLPLLFGGSYHLLKALFSTFGAQNDSNKNLDSGFFKSNEASQNNEMSSEEPRPDFLTLLDQVSFGVYTNLFAFLFAMLFIELFIKIIQNGIQEGFSFARLRKGSSSYHAREWKLFNMISENQIKRTFSYLVIFMILQIIGLFSSLVVQNEISTNVTRHPTFISSPLDQMSLMSHDNAPRILEEVNEQQILSSSSSSVVMTPDKISLSMGSVLGSLNLKVNAMVLSKDKKTAFVTIDIYGYLKIIDISDLQSPFVISSLSLRVSIGDYQIKSLILSSDEKTLYTSNTMNLEIVDVSDLSSPKLISETSSEIFNASSYEELSTYFKTSLAVSESTKTLYIGGLGLQVYDISNPKEPVLLRAFKNSRIGAYGYVLERNEICLSQDEKTLFIANGTLDVFDISNPKEMNKIDSFNTTSSPRSLLLLEDSSTLLLLGSSDEDGIIFEEADISSLSSFKIRKTHKLGGWTSFYSPRFLAISPSRSKVFIYADLDLDGIPYLLVFDRIKETTKNAGTKLIDKTFAMEFFADGKKLITGSSNQFMTIELFLDYPNNQIFSASQENLMNNISFPFCEEMQMSGDGKYLFALCRTQEDYPFAFSIWDVKDLSAPRTLYDPDNRVHEMHFTKNYQTVYLVGVSSIIVLDITNIDEAKIKKTYKFEDPDTTILYFIASSDEKTGFIIRSVGLKKYVSFIDLSNPPKINILLTLDIEFETFWSRLILKDNDKTLILLTQKMTIYDISDLLSPKPIASLSFGVNEPDPDINSYFLSPDSKILYIDTMDNHRLHKLKVYNISISASPQLISDNYLPKVLYAGSQLSLSPDLKTGYLYQPNSLIRWNLTDLKHPQITGVIPLVKNKTDRVLTYVISPDGQEIYVGTETQIRVINMEIEYSLFLKQEKFLLGKKYTNSLAMLRMEKSEYNLMDPKSYRIIKFSLLDTKVVPTKENLEMTNSPLPIWIAFDRESNTLTVEAKKQRDIGTYTLCSNFALKIPRNIFQKLPVSSQNLWAWLISLDYIDNQLFLTDSFGLEGDFFLPEEFGNYTGIIYQTLKKYHVETCTSFEVISSLELNNKSLLAVSSLSTSPVKAEIKLDPGKDVDAKFVSTHYGPLMPVMKDYNKTKIALEGTMGEINTALNSVVVNFENGTSCNATLIINDGLNPPVPMELKNISKYFKTNQPPKINQKVDKTIQEQINLADIQTGKYFTFTLSDDIFEDEYAENNLQYEVVMANKNIAFPIWLSLNGLTLKGTPPEEISGRDLDLVLIAKNEFKQHGVPFKLHISISPAFLLKLIMRYSPYILTMIGLIVSANKIFNILGKDFYKHSKEFYVGVGQEANVIFPISFIKEEMRQSQLILRQLGNINLIDFIKERGILDKEKIISKIKEAIMRMPVEIKKQMKLYPSSVIDQIIINKFIWRQLDLGSERKTKSLFEDLKADCLEIVERDATPKEFIINQNKLMKRIQREPVETLEEESLIRMK